VTGSSDQFFDPRSFKSNKTLPGNPWQGFENLRSKALVAGAARSRCGNPHNSGRHYGNRTRCCRTGSGTTGTCCACRLRHRVAGERREEESRYELFHETPQKKETTSLMVRAH
jgi:hypothetical protein